MFFSSPSLLHHFPFFDAAVAALVAAAFVAAVFVAATTR